MSIYALDYAALARLESSMDLGVSARPARNANAAPRL